MVKEIKDKSNQDVLLYVYSLLKRLGCGKVNTFEQRLKSQKVQYFAQLFGVSLRYQYNLYLNGPYSPGLAHDLYQIKELKMKPMLEKFIPEELEQKFNDTKKFVKGLSVRELEITATYHWLLKIVKMTAEETCKKLIEWKGATQKELDLSKNKLKQYEQIKKSYS